MTVSETVLRWKIRELEKANAGLSERVQKCAEAIELCADVLVNVQKAYDCPDSPIINLAIAQSQAAIDLLAEGAKPLNQDKDV